MDFWPIAGGVLVLVGFPVTLGTYVRSLREVAFAAHRRAEESERRRESELREARAAERTAVARELHDLVAHHVASIVLRAGVARHVAGDGDPRVVEVLDDVHRTGTAALDDLRRLVGVLRDPAAVHSDPSVSLVDPADLFRSIESIVERVRGAGVKVETQVDPAVTDVDAVRRAAVLRVVQESLTNVLRHAGSDATARVTIGVSRERAVQVEVVDDGMPVGRWRGALI